MGFVSDDRGEDEMGAEEGSLHPITTLMVRSFVVGVECEGSVFPVRESLLLNVFVLGQNYSRLEARMGKG